MTRLMSALAYDAPKMSPRRIRSGMNRRIGKLMRHARGVLKSQAPVW
jgi:hypothetical protein